MRCVASKERFAVLVYFDGIATDECKIHCRMEDLKLTIKNGEYFSYKDAVKELFTDIPTTTKDDRE
jgi:hypothetical protein